MAWWLPSGNARKYVMAEMAGTTIEVLVAYADPAGKQQLWRGKLPAGAKVADALAKAGVAVRLDDLGAAGVGIYGCVVSLDQTLQTGDRVELYRPLRVDPKQARRQRAAARRRRVGSDC